MRAIRIDEHLLVAPKVAAFARSIGSAGTEGAVQFSGSPSAANASTIRSLCSPG
jgi:hypothetical protein